MPTSVKHAGGGQRRRQVITPPDQDMMRPREGNRNQPVAHHSGFVAVRSTQYVSTGPNGRSATQRFCLHPTGAQGQSSPFSASAEIGAVRPADFRPRQNVFDDGVRAVEPMH